MNIYTDFLNGTTVDKNALVQFAKQFHVKFKYEDENFNKILFYTESKPADPSAVARFANGYICECVDGKWEAVGLPLPVMENTKTLNYLTENINSYMVFPVHEATIINCYWSNLENRWMFGTKKSFDISDQMWRGLKYSDVIKQYDLPLEDKNTTYIFALSDARWHLRCKKSQMILIATHDKDGNITCEDALDIEPVEALRIYRNTNFGFIFRNAEHSFILESDEFAAVSKILYKPSRHRNRHTMVQYAQNLSDMDYITTRAYFLHSIDTAYYFPELMQDFQRIKKIVEFFVNHICAIILDKPTAECPFSAAIEDFYNTNKKSFLAIKDRRSFKKKIRFAMAELKIIETIFPVLKNYRDVLL
jgi:hypothetical protein